MFAGMAIDEISPSFLLSGLLAWPAAAIPQCSPRDRMLELLWQNFQEQRRAVGVTSGGALLEVMSSASGSWTIIITSPEGQACVLGGGHGWRTTPPPKIEDPL